MEGARRRKRNDAGGVAQGAVFAAAILACASLQGAAGEELRDERYELNIPSTDIDMALFTLARETGRSLVIPSETAKGRSKALNGVYTLPEALSALLEGTNLSGGLTDSGVITISAGRNGNEENREFDMTGDKMKKGFLAGVSALVFGAGGASAQDVQRDELAADQDTIIVTASRREQSLQDVPAAISVAQPADFIEAGLTSISDVADYTPGVTFRNAQGAAGQGWIIMRGVSQESATAVTAVYLDDVPITSSGPFSMGSEVLLDGLIGDVERVEISKGPQGTLFGAGALGGVVRYITRDPALDEMRATFLADVSTTHEGGVSQLYRGNVSLPLIEDKLGVTIGGFHNKKAGFIDRLDPFTQAVIEKDYNTAEINGVNVAALWQVTDRARLKVTGLHQKTTVRGTSAVAFGVADVTAPDFVPLAGELQFAGFDPGSEVIEYYKADATLNIDFDWAELTAVSGFAKYQNPTNTDQANSPGLTDLMDILTGSAPGTTTNIPTYIYGETRRFVEEIRLASPNNETFEWLVGAYYARENAKNVQDIVAAPQQISLVDVSFPSVYEEFAVFADATYYITPEFDVTAGLRYSDNSFESEFNFAGLLIPALQQSNKSQDGTLTYLFNARWRPTEELSLYTRVASGFRPAFVNVPVMDPLSGNSTSTIVEADKLWSYEVGAKGGLLEGRLQYDLALWYIDWDNFQATLVINGLNTGGNSTAGMKSRGFEASLRAHVTDALTIDTNVAYAKGELKADSIEIGALKGEPTRFVPDWTASVRANYAFTLGGIDGVARVGARYVGDYSTAYVGGYSQTFGQNVGFGDIRFPIEDYTLVDIGATFRKGNVALNLYATNLLDKYAYANGGVTVAGPSASATGYVVEPRRIGAALELSF